MTNATLHPQLNRADAVGLVATMRVNFYGINGSGALQVSLSDGTLVLCDLLDSLDTRPWQPGEALLIALSGEAERPIVVGRIVTKPIAPIQSSTTIEATESLTLKCGESSLTLRADGKVMVKGDDVLIRAKGTQRIRAGNVAIN